MRRPAVVVLLGVMTAGCATRADVEDLGSSLRADIERIREDNTRLLQQIGVELDSLDAAGNRRDNTVRGELERRVSSLETMMNQVLEMQSQNNQLLNDIYQSTASGGMPSTRPGSPGATRDPIRPGGAGDVDAQLYQMAQDQFRVGNLDTAREAFENFVSEAPNHELAPDAQYYVGRCYEDAGDLENALAAYQRVMELYPASQRAPTSLYRRAGIEEERGNTAIARRLYAQVANGYPDSPEAPEAEAAIRRLGGERG
jgi:tol-pal system protein YbgF